GVCEPEERAAGRQHDRRFFVRDALRDAIERVDVIDGVFGEPAVGGETIRAVPAFGVAVIQARRIQAANAVLAAAAAHVRLDDHPVADPKLVHGPADGHDVARVLVPEDELALPRHLGHAGVDAFQISASDAARAHPYEHRLVAGPRPPPLLPLLP